MDELDKLKKAWDRSFDKQPQAPGFEQIHEIVRKKSSGPAGKLKKSLRIEIGAVLIAIPLLVAIMFKMPEPYFLFNTGALLLVFAGSLVYYFTQLRKLEAIWSHRQQNIKASLESTLMLTRFFRKIYFWLNIILFPFGIYFGYVVGFGLGSGGQRVTDLAVFDGIPLLVTLLIVFSIAGFFCLVFYLFLKIYIRKLYDIHIHKLEDILQELEEID